MRTRWVVACLAQTLLSAVLIAPAVAAPMAITAIDLDTLGGPYSQAVAVNASGWVVGNRYDPNDLTVCSRAFIWNPNTGAAMDLPTFPGLTGTNPATMRPYATCATAVNDSGQVVGYSDAVPLTSTDPRQHAFFWDPGSNANVIIDLTPDPNPVYGWNSQATAVNNAGQVVGCFDTAGQSGRHAFIWTTANELVDLGSVGFVSDYVQGNSCATAVNKNGVVVGYTDSAPIQYTDPNTGITYTTPGLPHAFSLDARSMTALVSALRAFKLDADNDPLTNPNPMIDLGTLADGTYSFAQAVSAGGRVVGYAEAEVSTIATQRAVSWDPGATSPTNLGALGTNSVAQAVNAGGQVVGYYYTGNPASDNTTRAFSWSGGAMADVGSLAVDAQGNSVPNTTSYALAVSDNGQVVGYSNGFDDSGNPVVRAFSWTATGGPMLDLGTLGGPSSQAVAVKGNFAVGAAETSTGETHAALWNLGLVFPSGLIGPPTVATGNSAATLITTGGITITVTGAGGSALDQTLVGEYPYNVNPVGTALQLSSGVFFDVRVVQPSTYTSVTIKVCPSNGAGLSWWNGTVWAVVPAVADVNTGCLTFIATATSSPGLADLHGTVFGLTLPTGVAPAITTPPVSQTIASNTTATLSVVATGTAPLTYQWYQGTSGNTATPVGTNSASFTTPALTVATNYWVHVTNAYGQADSTTAAIAIGVAPAITTPPVSQTIASAATATLSVVATGTAPLTYQWYQGTSPTTTTPVGTNSASFTTPALAAATSYWVRVSNAYGSANSTTATITIQSSASPVLITPAILDFGNVYLRGPQSSNVTIKNTGTTPISLATPSITPGPGSDRYDFNLVNLCSRTLAAGASCTIIVVASADEIGPDSATLNISAAGIVHQVSLAANVINPIVVLAPLSVNFGTVAVGTQSLPRVVTLKNIGTTALEISNIKLTGTRAADYSMTKTCGNTLAPTATCTASVVFNPLAAGSRPAGLTFTDNARTKTQTVPLSGTGN